ncbi:MAG: DUF4367 domain-containing protein [Paraclostridium sp.]
MSKIEITDDLLYEYYPKVEEYLLDNLPKEDEIEYEFSELFNKKMKKLIKESNRPTFLNNIYKYSKRISIVIIAFIISIFTLTMSVEAFREKLFDLIREVHKEFTIYQFRTKDGKYIEESKFKLPTYLPEGLKEIERHSYDDSRIIIYESDSLYLYYDVFRLTDSNLYLDTEDAETSKVMINGIEADYIVKGNNYKLVWEENNNVYILIIDDLDGIDTKATQKDLIKIAENLK